MNALLAHQPYSDLITRAGALDAELTQAEASADDARQAATEARTAADAAEVDAITAGKPAPANIVKAAKAAAQVAADAEDRVRILHAAKAQLGERLDAAQTEAKAIVAKQSMAEHEAAAAELVRLVRQIREVSAQEVAVRARAYSAGVMLPAFALEGITGTDSDRQGLLWAWRYGFAARKYTWPAEEGKRS